MPPTSELPRESIAGNTARGVQADARAVPVVLAELGWVTMGIVDTLMVGPLGAEAIGAVGLGSTLFISVCVFRHHLHGMRRGRLPHSGATDHRRFYVGSGGRPRGVSLLAIAAVFQLFDGVQGVTTGILRGLCDTRTPMLWNLAGHWFIGLPLGYGLCFAAGLGIAGIWWGLSVGLIICGAALLAVWYRRVDAMA